jgi:cytidylate kinase
MDGSARPVVTISRQIGAGGAYVGQALAHRLGIRYVDREILKQAATLLGRDEQDLAAIEERPSTIWDRVASILALGAPEAPFVPPPLPTSAEDELFEVESRVIQEIAAREAAVFVGRAAGWVLREHPGVLRVFLHAPEEWRAERIKETYDLPDLAAARRLVHKSDQQRGRFIHALLGADWMAPSGFDLCVNTATVGMDPTVELLVALVLARQPQL